LYVFDDDRQSLEIEIANGIEGHVNQDRIPLEDRIDAVSYTPSGQLGYDTDATKAGAKHLPPATLWTLCWMKK
jgi:hypothetical protein